MKVSTYYSRLFLLIFVMPCSILLPPDVIFKCIIPHVSVRFSSDALAAFKINNNDQDKSNDKRNTYIIAVQTNKNATKLENTDDKPIDVTKKRELNARQIADKYLRSVVTIITLDESNQPLSIGSGFFINTIGDIVTNFHVLEGGSKAIIKTSSGEVGDILNIIKSDSLLDIVVVRTSIKKSFPLPIGDSDKVHPGEEIIAIGNPAGLEGTLSKGIVSGVRDSDGVKMIQITSPISPGSSGGPIVNSYGEAIGIATSFLTVGQNLNFAMPINYLKTLRTDKIDIKLLKSDKKEKKHEVVNLVVLRDILINKCGYSYPRDNDVCGVEFVLSNDSEYHIKNIQLLFIFKKQEFSYAKWQSEALMGNEKRYEEQKKNAGYSWYGSEGYKKYWEIEQKIIDSMPPNKEKEYVISYSNLVIKNILSAKMGLQYGHKHFVKWDAHYDNSGYTKLDLEIRVLNYDIVRN